MLQLQTIEGRSLLKNSANYVYFNNAATAYPLAPGVADSVTKALQEPPQVSGREIFSSGDSLGRCREALAKVLDVSASQVVLVPGATYGLNTAILGLGLKQGDLIITTVMEHNSVLRPLARLEDKCGVRVKYAPLDGEMKLDENAYDELLAEKPRLVVMTHASNVTGRINPALRLFEKAKAAGALTLLDAAQTIGRISVRPGELCADIVVFSGHKGLRGPLGTGALYVAPQIELDPVYTGGTGVKSDLRLQPMEMPMRLEPGTPNTPAFAGLYAAVCHYGENAFDIAEKEIEVLKRLYAGLSSIPNIRIFDADLSDRLPIISFSVRGNDADTVGFALSESFGVECRTGLHCAPLMREALGVAGTVRLSPSYANDAGDIDYAIEAVRMIAT